QRLHRCRAGSACGDAGLSWRAPLRWRTHPQRRRRTSAHHRGAAQGPGAVLRGRQRPPSVTGHPAFQRRSALSRRRPAAARHRRRRPLPAMTRLSAPLLSTPSPRAPRRHATASPLPASLGAHSRGFTLVELAMVLVILALLGSALLVPLGSRIEARDRQLSLDRLHDIQHALIGFALIHGRLPCPSSEADPTSPLYGLEDAP
ncbi:type II secretion system protein, partial [Arthrospira platensis SPKY1]|nr:type II secretion system protein [Arthrospira platensis SPKY1]